MISLFGMFIRMSSCPFQTESGTVEMDAGIMDGSNLLFGAVGAVPGIKNPVQVARLLVQEQTKGLLPLGRVPPIFMVGEGARDWAARHGVTPVEDERELVSEKANKLFRHYKKKLESFRQSSSSSSSSPAGTSVKRSSKTCSPSSRAESMQQPESTSTPKRQKVGEGVSNGEGVDCAPEPKDDDDEVEILEVQEVDDHVTDTVGVVAMDVFGNVASTVSSGGIALKQPGRVGQVRKFKILINSIGKLHNLVSAGLVLRLRLLGPEPDGPARPSCLREYDRVRGAPRQDILSQGVRAGAIRERRGG